MVSSPTLLVSCSERMCSHLFLRPSRPESTCFPYVPGVYVDNDTFLIIRTFDGLEGVMTVYYLILYFNFVKLV